MFDIIVGKNCYAALGGQTPLDKRLPDGACSIPCMLVGQVAPVTVEPAPGGGACFRITLPRRDPPEAPEESPLADAALAGSHGTGTG